MAYLVATNKENWTNLSSYHTLWESEGRERAKVAINTHSNTLLRATKCRCCTEGFLYLVMRWTARLLSECTSTNAGHANKTNQSAGWLYIKVYTLWKLTCSTNEVII